LHGLAKEARIPSPDATSFSCEALANATRQLRRNAAVLTGTSGDSGGNRMDDERVLV
jgi:hypothetical protein